MFCAETALSPACFEQEAVSSALLEEKCVAGFYAAGSGCRSCPGLCRKCYGLEASGVPPPTPDSCIAPTFLFNECEAECTAACPAWSLRTLSNCKGE